MVGHYSGVDGELPVHPGGLPGEDVICIGFKISKPLTSMGHISPKLEKIETFTNIFQWMTTIFNAISNATKYTQSN